MKVLEGKLTLRIEAHRSDDALNALKLTEKFKDMRLVLEGLSSLNDDAWAKVLESRWPLVVGPVLPQGARPDYFNRHTLTWLQQALQSEGLICLATFGSTARESSWLRAHAAQAVAEGMDLDRALAAITSNAARVLGVADEVGSIEVGKSADLAVFSGHPLDPAAAVRMTISAGQVTFENPSAQPAAEAEPATTAEWSPPPRFPTQFALMSQQVLRPDGEVGPATIIIGNGEILSVEPTLTRPAGMPVYDIGASMITPGLAAVVQLPRSNLIGSEVEADSGHLRAVDGFDPTGAPWRRLLRGGCTTVIAVPAGKNVIGGQIGALRIGANGNAVAEPSLGVLLGLSNESRDADRFPASLMGQIKMLHDWLEGKLTDSRLLAPQRALDQLKQDRRRLVEAVTDGAKTVALQAETTAEIRAATRFGESAPTASLPVSASGFKDDRRGSRPGRNGDCR